MEKGIWSTQHRNNGMLYGGVHRSEIEADLAYRDWVNEQTSIPNAVKRIMQEGPAGFLLTPIVIIENLAERLEWKANGQQIKLKEGEEYYEWGNGRFTFR